MYAQTYDDYYPIAHYNQMRGSEIFGYSWDFTIINDLNTSELEVVPGLLWQGRTIEKIQQCPSFKGESNAANDPYTGYNYNTSYIGHGEGEHTNANYSGEIRSIETEIFPGVSIKKKIVMPAKSYNISRPVRCALFGDGGFNRGANKFMRAPLVWDGDTYNGFKAAGVQAYRHADMTNVAWADGHTSSQKQYYTETTDTEKAKIDNYNNTVKYNKVGFLSPDNSAYDLK